MDDYLYEEDRLGMTVTSGVLTLKKDHQNLIGISIGGGAPHCPCLYVVQIFDNTPAAKDGTLASGDELTSVGHNPVKGRTKVEVARMIQACKDEVIIGYNKLHADPKTGKSLDIVLKKMKHRVVETLNSSTADALGLSRAILCNDSLVKKMKELEGTAGMYQGLVQHTKCLLRGMFDLAQVHRDFGEVFASIGVKEPQPAASEAFTAFGEAHRTLEKYAIQMLKTCKPMISDMNTYLMKAVPDTQLTVRKYLDVKFEYLSYCLKVKEMDDEEYAYVTLQEPLYRVETGNYEYRLILRCRQDARARFAKMRSDVLVKMELLDQKKVQDIVHQLQKLIAAMSAYHQRCDATMRDAEIFPIEVDLNRHTFTYDTSGQFNDDAADDDDEGDDVEAAAVAGLPTDGPSRIVNTKPYTDRVPAERRKSPRAAPPSATPPSAVPPHQDVSLLDLGPDTGVENEWDRFMSSR